MTIPIVTAHAILRYLERVEGHDMPALRAAARRAGINPAHKGKLLEWLRANSAIEIDAVTALLDGPKVRMALAVRAKTVRIGAFVIVLDHARVVTIKPVEKLRMRPPRYRGDRRREAGRRDQRIEREEVL